MDAGLMIKELASLIGVAEDTVINWEVRGVMPTSMNFNKVNAFISRNRKQAD